MKKDKVLFWSNRYLPTTRQQELESLLRNDSFTSAFLQVMGKAFTKSQAQNTQSLENWFWNAWPGLSTFSVQEQAILKYYYPLCRLLKTDTEKSHCLTTIFGLPVQVQEFGKRCHYDDSISYLQEGLAYEERTTPFNCPIITEFLIEVGPFEATLLPAWMPGGRDHSFLSNGILPLILPHNADVRVLILKNEGIAYESTIDTPVYWDHNFKPLEGKIFVLS